MVCIKRNPYAYDAITSFFITVLDQAGCRQRLLQHCTHQRRQDQAAGTSNNVLRLMAEKCNPRDRGEKSRVSLKNVSLVSIRRAWCHLAKGLNSFDITKGYLASGSTFNVRNTVLRHTCLQNVLCFKLGVNLLVVMHVAHQNLPASCCASFMACT